MEVSLKGNERLDDLLAEGLHIIQSRDVFSFSMDAVLLARFVSLPPNGKVIDLCTGNGVIPLLMSTRTKAHITGVEIQPLLTDMATRSVKYNRLENRIDIINEDLKVFPAGFGHGKWDVVTCNPPYLPVTTGIKNINPHYALARHEIASSLEDCIRVSSQLVRTGGKVAFVHRPNRLVDIVMTMRMYRIEPKRLRLVHPRIGSPPNMVLIEGMKEAKPDLNILPPLIVYKDETTYHKEIDEIYNGKR